MICLSYLNISIMIQYNITISIDRKIIIICFAWYSILFYTCNYKEYDIDYIYMKYYEVYLFIFIMKCVCFI